MMTTKVIKGALLGSVGVLVLGTTLARADDDAAYIEKAKAFLETVAAPVTKWDGPTTGPKAQGKKLIVIVSTDQRNGGAQGAGDGAAEAAKAMGWDVRQLDGQGTVPGHATAMTQAIAMKPNGILNVGIDHLDRPGPRIALANEALTTASSVPDSCRAPESSAADPDAR